MVQLMTEIPTANEKEVGEQCNGCGAKIEQAKIKCTVQCARTLWLHSPSILSGFRLVLPNILMQRKAAINLGQPSIEAFKNLSLICTALSDQLRGKVLVYLQERSPNIWFWAHGVARTGLFGLMAQGLHYNCLRYSPLS